MNIEERQARSTRDYRMVARAAAAEATQRRILEAATRLFGEQPYDQVSLQAVAEQAGVTVQTVLRRCDSKEELFGAVADWTSSQVREERDQAPVGDVPGIVQNVIDNYERWGDHFLNLLAQERRASSVHARTERGRDYHRAWVERVFAPQLAVLSGEERARSLAQLVAGTDLYTWKVLRRDLGLSREETEAAMGDLVQKITHRC